MLINSLVHVTVLLSDLNIPSALQNRPYSEFTNLKNHVITALDVVLTELQIFQQENLLECFSNNSLHTHEIFDIVLLMPTSGC